MASLASPFLVHFQLKKPNLFCMSLCPVWLPCWQRTVLWPNAGLKNIVISGMAVWMLLFKTGIRCRRKNVHTRPFLHPKYPNGKKWGHWLVDHPILKTFIQDLISAFFFTDYVFFATCRRVLLMFVRLFAEVTIVWPLRKVSLFTSSILLPLSWNRETKFQAQFHFGIYMLQIEGPDMRVTFSLDLIIFDS